jgi:hypothetical protein
MNDIESDQVKNLLLDLLSPSQQVSAQMLTCLEPEAQAAFLQSVQDHRLGPLLRYMLSQYHQDVIVPDHIKLAIDISFKTAAFRSLNAQQSLINIHRLLSQHQTPYIALKGAYLAFHAYPQSALRPMRDLDILVPEDRALEVYELLKNEGFQRLLEYQDNPKIASKNKHHLPALIDPISRILIEIHTSLSGSDDAAFGLAADEAFWSRSIERPIASVAIRFESSTDLLLHLICHAVYHHRFDNGPLLITDIAFLLDGQEIDWPLFWEIALRENITAGCVLVLKMVERYWPQTLIKWPSTPVKFPSDAILKDAAILLLRDYKLRGVVGFKDGLVNADGILQQISLLFNKVFPTRAYIFAFYGLPTGSLKVYGYYLVYLLRNRLPKMLKSISTRHTTELARLQRLDDWLT